MDGSLDGAIGEPPVVPMQSATCSEGQLSCRGLISIEKVQQSGFSFRHRRPGLVDF
jgi:hypothetical protein